ncbi:alpha,alpha-trehalose-phosphate synthase (UDP-forming) [Sulfurovum sp. CS9]|uniref:alpha,alpha-trehalose-phosphate synthase (UDP-forming) n=1 Tax=Sulfurovum sp. CS9 TaxID=3391146 RepID=UPI0039EB151D
MSNEALFDGRLVIVSNRLPVVMEKTEKKKYKFKPAVGGLVTAMEPILKKRKGLWIGWAGDYKEEEINTKELLKNKTKEVGYDLIPVELSIANYNLYYEGYSNEILWPLFHNFSSYCVFKPEFYTAYEEVNKKFADTVFENLNESDFVWIHDYHLIKVAGYLREMGTTNRIAYFLHIPFPPLETFMRMPNRQKLFDALLEYDLIGFQTEQDKKNFIDVVYKLTELKQTEAGSENICRLTDGSREISVGSFAISIDYDEFSEGAKRKKVLKKSKELKETYLDQLLMFGVDRLDYTKGIPQKLKAYRMLLEENLELRGRVKLIQILVPSRENISQYADLKSEIEQLVGQINGSFSQPGWIPIEYRYCTIKREEILAYYQACDIVLVTPLKDGMNLVAKEYCASKSDANGVLILSEFAGAMHQLKCGALPVNPFDIKSLVSAMKRAISMSKEEQKERMLKLQQNIRSYDIYWWADSFLGAARYVLK